MSDRRVPVPCPACSATEPTAHEVLNRGGQATVRCTDCGHVHKATLGSSPSIERRVVVSQEDESFTARVEFDPDEEVAVGDEFLVETEEAILTARVTDLELVDGARTDAALAREVRTVWSRAVGNVSVNLTLHPRDGGHDRTRSAKIQVPGDETFTVGETHDYADEEFTVEKVILRDDAHDGGRTHFEHAGDTVPARDVKRLYARDETATSRAWSGW